MFNFLGILYRTVWLKKRYKAAMYIQPPIDAKESKYDPSHLNKCRSRVG
jgi:hypothetical protein